MYQIFVGSLILSIIHASIPNHWIPLITIGKTEQWTQKQTLWATIVAGFAHTLSTVIVGIVVGLLGYKLASKYELISSTIAPIILVIIGLVYIGLDFKENRHHKHHHDELNIKEVNNSHKTRFAAIITTLSIAMFLTPCVEIEVYYFQAGTIGWSGIFLVSVVYTFSTVILMLILVFLGLKGIKNLQFHFLEHHEKIITGFVLIALGFLSFLVKF